jgi:hypothetical protein
MDPTLYDQRVNWRITATIVTLRNLIVLAYGLKDYQDGGAGLPADQPIRHRREIFGGPAAVWGKV